MTEKCYVYSSTDKEIKEYESLELFLEEAVDEDYLEEQYNECFEYLNLPIVGKIGTGTVLRKLNRLWEGLDSEIEYLYDDLTYQLERDDVIDFYGYTISNNKDLLIESKENKNAFKGTRFH